MKLHWVHSKPLQINTQKGRSRGIKITVQKWFEKLHSGKQLL